MAAASEDAGDARAYRVRLSGREPISHPLAPVVIDVARRLHARGLAAGHHGAIALRAGRTMLTTAHGSDLGALELGDLVEVADYDPVERLLLAVGPREPGGAAALLWLVLRHRDEVGAALLVPALSGAASPDSVQGLSVAASAGSGEPLDAAKACLRALRDAPVVAFPGIGILATGSGVPGAERNLMTVLARLDPSRFAGDAWAGPESGAPTKRRNGGARTKA